MPFNEKGGLKRKTIRLTNPNPLFEKWITEWRDEAASRNSDTQYAFAKALKSLKKYPLPLKTGKECLILENFGTRICLLLDRKLADYHKSHPNNDLDFVSASQDDHLNIPHTNDSETSAEDAKTKFVKTPTKKKATGKSYVPTIRSSSYAVLLALYQNLKTNGPPGEMTKLELQKAAQPWCDTSMFKPLPGSYYSGWSCVGQLTNKQLITHLRNSNPHRYKLTPEGIEVAEKLPNPDSNIVNNSPNNSPIKSQQENNIKSKPPGKRKTKSKNITVTKEVDLAAKVSIEEDDICSQKSSDTREIIDDCQIFLPETFHVILLVDTQEIHKGDELVKALEALGVNVEVRKLTVGDFAWVGRNHQGQELLLPYLIERKRLDDLASSIKDGRFHEQKFRMKQCGVTNCMYLVESHGQRQYSLPLPTLLQAAANTQYIDRFTVKHTANSHETVVYLASFTKVIAGKFCNKTLIGCRKSELPSFDIDDDCVSLMSFKEFNKLSCKVRKYTVREMFIKQLVQLKGLSVEKALAIVDRYPSPSSLMAAYKLEIAGVEMMLANIVAGSMKRKIGPVISKAVYDLYNKPVLS